MYALAAEMRQSIEDIEGAAATRTDIGVVHYSVGELNKAAVEFEKALTLWQQSGNRTGQIQTSSNLAAYYAASGQSQRALDLLERTLPLAQSPGDAKGEAYILSTTGRIYDELGDAARAISNFEAASALMSKVGDTRGQTSTLINVGAVYFSQRDFPKALDCYQRALASPGAKDPFVQTPALLNLARLRDAMGKRELALDINRQAVSQARSIEDRRSESAAHSNMGFIYLRAGQPREALKHLQTALPLFHAMGFLLGEANTRLLIARSKVALDDLMGLQLARSEYGIGAH